MYSSRTDQKQLELLAEQVLLNERTRQDKEIERKYGESNYTRRKEDWSRIEPYQKKQISTYNKYHTDKAKEERVNSGQYTSKVGKKFLVRCLNNLIGVYTKPDGSVVFNRADSDAIVTSRKTVHFAINGAVSSHAFNSWEEAMIAIIADPNNIDAKPRSTSVEDTWYVVDKNDELNVGRALILLPSNMSIPDNIKTGNIQRYEGNTREDRDKAIKSYIAKNGGKVISIHAHGGDLEDEMGSWGEDRVNLNPRGEEGIAIKKELNGQNVERFGSPHIGTLENQLENFFITMKSVNQEAQNNNLQLQDAFNSADEKDLVAFTSFESFINSGNGLFNRLSHYLVNNRNKIDKNTYYYLAKAQKNIKDFLVKNNLLSKYS